MLHVPEKCSSRALSTSGLGFNWAFFFRRFSTRPVLTALRIRGVTASLEHPSGLCLMALPPSGLVEMIGYPLPLARLGV